MEPAAIEFRLLGAVEAVRDGSVLPLGGKRQRALLALLLVEAGRPIAAERLAEELWQGAPPAGAQTTLPSYVSRLRSALGVEIPSGPAGYSLGVPPEQVDATRFERLVGEGREALSRRTPRRAAERLRAALELWRGPPFADVGGEGALRLEAERLGELRLLALEDRIDAELQLGAGAELVEELEALVGEHPYRERLWRHLMLALYHAQRQADALEAYRRAGAILRRELGLEPGDELKALEGAILRQEVTPASPPEERHNLPAPLTSFIGRAQELVEISRLLDETRLLTLTGVGGVGKTRLALEAARHALPDFPDGVYFVDLTSLADGALVPRHVSASLGVRESGDSDIEQLLVARLRTANVLLVLDNCEHLREACAELARDLLGAAPRVRVLSTSRELLGTPGEVDYAVPPLAPPDALELFLLRVRAARPQLSVDDRALATAADICSELDGLPLAVELAAARAKALSLEEIESRLSDRFRFLVSWRRLSSARHRTLREAMDWSYELLSPEQQALLARLSVFAGGFTLAAAARVCVDADEELALELLAGLVNASLVVADERDGRMRYRLLETVREYAAARLEETSGTGGTQKAHAEFFVELTESAELRGAEQQRWLAMLDSELGNVRAALDYTTAVGDAETQFRLLGAFWRYWYFRGYLAEGRRRLDSALARQGRTAGILSAPVLFGAGLLSWMVGDWERGREVAGRLLANAKARGSIRDELNAWKLLGFIAHRERDFAEAERYSRLVLLLAQELGDEIELLFAKLNLAVPIMDAGRIEEALPILEDTLAGYRRSGSVDGAGLALLNIGEAALLLGDLDRARASIDEARMAFESVGFRVMVGRTLEKLAWVETRRGNHLEAARLLGRAASVVAEIGAFDLADLARTEEEVRAALGDDAFAVAYEEGRQQADAPG